MGFYSVCVDRPCALRTAQDWRRLADVFAVVEETKCSLNAVVLGHQASGYALGVTNLGAV
jgi:hypothetical protein